MIYAIKKSRYISFTLFQKTCLLYKNDFFWGILTNNFDKDEKKCFIRTVFYNTKLDGDFAAGHILIVPDFS